VKKGGERREEEGGRGNKGGERREGKSDDRAAVAVWVHLALLHHFRWRRFKNYECHVTFAGQIRVKANRKWGRKIAAEPKHFLC